MDRLIVSARRVVLLIVLVAAGSTAYTWWRDRKPALAPINPPEWPPLRDASTAAAPDDDVPVSTASFVNALVDTPDARSATDEGSWVPPNADGSCPDGYPIKANDNSGIYHTPDGRFYERTKPERCYATSAAAEADGYRAAKS